MGNLTERKKRILLNEPHIATVTGNPVSVETDIMGKLKECKASFTPIQSGTGDHSPSNVRPITGWTGMTINHSDEDTSDPITYPVTFPAEIGTVYGGSLDAVSGVLEVSNGYIASYNGETLPGKWISDRDVYVAGTTPTTGAEVVYELATPIVIDLTPVEITTLIGDNTIWSDANGNLEIKLWKH